MRKILKYGNLTLNIDLDPQGEVIFLENLKDVIRMAESDTAWRKLNNIKVTGLQEAKSKGTITRETGKNKPEINSKPGIDKNRKVKP